MNNWIVDPMPSYFVIDEEDNLVAIALDPEDAKLLAASSRLLNAVHAARTLIVESDSPQARAVLLMIDKAIAETK